MKTGFKKLFKKKTKNPETADQPSPKDTYTSMSSDSLFSMPVSELVSIIFKYDSELKSLNQDLTTAKDQNQTLKQSFQKLQDESSLYKETKDNAQFECHRLATELNEAVTSLDSCQSQLELAKTQLASKDSMLNTLKSRVSELEKQNCELQLTGIHITPNDETENLRKKLAECNKLEQTIRELKVKNESLENELKKISASAVESKEQARMWKEKTNAFDKAMNDSQVELSKKKTELEDLKTELKKLAFIRESMETENRSLKESLSQKEASVKKKNEKIGELNKLTTQLQQSISLLKFENESSRLKARQEIQFEIENERAQQIAERQMAEENFVLEINGLKESLKDVEEIKRQLEQSKAEKERIEQDLMSKGVELSEVHENIGKLTEEKLKLSETLKVSNNKRELARTEILKLTQKLETLQKSNSTIPDPKKVPKSITIEEVSFLSIIKPELDSLYKSLMSLISEANKDFYSVKITDFTSFEKKMNNLVVALHEQIEEISFSPPTSQTIPPARPTKGRTPIKLFSCIVDQDETQPRSIPKPKRPAYPNDNQSILRRGSAN